MKKDLSFSLMLIMIIIMVIPTPLAIDEYAPSLPYMVKALGTTIAGAQLSITVYLLALAIGQFILGPISDAYGRRPTVLYLTPIFFIGTLLCIFAHNIDMVLWGRFIQGIGISGCSLCATALISDCFEGDELNKVTSYYSTTYSLLPIIAPVIGGIIQDTAGWQGNFIFLLVFTVAAYIFFTMKQPETHIPDESHRLHPKILLGNYIKVLTHGQYLKAVFCSFLAWANIISFSVLAPFLLQNTLGYSAIGYGFLALLVGIGFMIGNVLNTYLVSRHPQAKILWVTLLLSLIVSVLFLIGSLLTGANVWLIMIPNILIMLSVGLLFPNFYALAISAIPELSGTAAALVNSINLLGVVIITALLTFFHAHSPVTMASLYVILAAVSIFCFWCRNKKAS